MTKKTIRELISSQDLEIELANQKRKVDVCKSVAHAFDLLMNDKRNLTLRNDYKQISPEEWIRIAGGHITNASLEFKSNKEEGETPLSQAAFTVKNDGEWIYSNASDATSKASFDKFRPDLIKHARLHTPVFGTSYYYFNTLYDRQAVVAGGNQPYLAYVIAKHIALKREVKANTAQTAATTSDGTVQLPKYTKHQPVEIQGNTDLLASAMATGNGTDEINLSEVSGDMDLTKSFVDMHQADDVNTDMSNMQNEMQEGRESPLIKSPDINTAQELITTYLRFYKMKVEQIHEDIYGEATEKEEKAASLNQNNKEDLKNIKAAREINQERMAKKQQMKLEVQNAFSEQVNACMDFLDDAFEETLELNCADSRKILNDIIFELQKANKASDKKLGIIKALLEDDNGEPGLVYKYKWSREKFIKAVKGDEQAIEQYAFDMYVAFNESDKLYQLVIKQSNFDNKLDLKKQTFLVLRSLITHGVDNAYIINDILSKRDFSIDEILGIKDEEGNTLMHHAAKQGALHTVQYCLACDKTDTKILTDKNAKDEIAVELAANAGHYHVVSSIIVEGGFDIEYKTHKGLTVRDIAKTASQLNDLDDALTIQSRLRTQQEPKSLVFEGGGVKGNSHMHGLNYALKGHNARLDLINLDKVEVVSGTSAGSINALLLACGYNVNEMLHIAENEIDFNDLADINKKIFDGSLPELKATLKPGVDETIKFIKEIVKNTDFKNSGPFTYMNLIYRVYSHVINHAKPFYDTGIKLMKQKALCEGETLKGLFKQKLDIKLETLRTSMNGLNDDNSLSIQSMLDRVLSDSSKPITMREFGQLVEYTRVNKLKDTDGAPIVFRHLRVAAYCLGGPAKDSEVFFCTDLKDPRVLNAPLDMVANAPVIDVIRASMSIPFFYKKAKINGIEYVDGGIVANFPFQLASHGFNPEEVMGFKLGLKENEIFTNEEPITIDESKEENDASDSDDIGKLLLAKIEESSGNPLQIIKDFISGDLFRQLSPIIKTQGAQFRADGVAKEQSAVIDVAEVGTVDFDLTKAQKLRQKYSAEFSMRRFAHHRLTMAKHAISKPLAKALASLDPDHSKAMPFQNLSIEQVLRLYAIASESDLPILRRLVNPNVRDSNKLTPLHLASAYRFNNIMDKLKKAGANESALTSHGHDYSSVTREILANEPYQVELVIDSEALLAIEDNDALLKKLRNEQQRANTLDALYQKTLEDHPEAIESEINKVLEMKAVELEAERKAHRNDNQENHARILKAYNEQLASKDVHRAEIRVKQDELAEWKEAYKENDSAKNVLETTLKQVKANLVSDSSQVLANANAKRNRMHRYGQGANILGLTLVIAASITVGLALSGIIAGLTMSPLIMFALVGITASLSASLILSGLFLRMQGDALLRAAKNHATANDNQIATLDTTLNSINKNENQESVVKRQGREVRMSESRHSVFNVGARDPDSSLDLSVSPTAQLRRSVS